MTKNSKISHNTFLEIIPKNLPDYFATLPGTYYNKGRTILRSELMKNLLFIEEGRGRIMNYKYQKNLFVQQHIYEGMFANLEAAFNTESYKSCFLEIKTSSLVKVIPFAVFNNLIETSIPFNRIVNQLLAKQVRYNQCKVNRLYNTSSKYRILYYLLELADEKGRPVGYETVIDIPPTHFEIADLSNTGRQTVTTLLSKMRNENIVHYNRRCFIFRDLAKVKEMMLLELKTKNEI